MRNGALRTWQRGILERNLAPPALVAQGIEHRFPKPCAKVRILPGAPSGLDPVSGTGFMRGHRILAGSLP